MINLYHNDKMRYLLLVTFTTMLTLIVILKLHYSYLPGDIFLARLIQRLVSDYVNVAVFISDLTSFPRYLILVAISCILTFLITKNYKITILAIVNFIGILPINKILKTLLSITRPSADLIQVIKKVTGSSFPSTSAIMYGATFGWLVILSLSNYTKLSSLSNLIILNMSLAVLLMNFLARVLLGAHWPSDIIFSYAICFIWMISLLRCLK